MEGVNISEYFNFQLDSSFDEILENNIKNIVCTAKELIPYFKGRDYFDELLHVGKIGLFEAYRSYDTSKNNGVSVKFWSHAQHRVKGSMIDFISKQSNMIRPSRIVESIGLKIVRGNLENESPMAIAEILNCSEKIADRALTFIKIKYVDSLNRPASYEHDSYNLELGDCLPSLTDFSSIDVKIFMSSLNRCEANYLQYKLSYYSDDEIERIMGIEKVELLDIQKAIEQKSMEVYQYEQIYMEKDDMMINNENRKPELTKNEFLKLKNNHVLEKDICKRFGISKSILIKLNKNGGFINREKNRLKAKL